MVIDDLDLLRIALVPDKADTPPVVDTDAVLPGSIAAQRLQPIARRGCQVAQLPRLMDLPQLALRNSLHIVGTIVIRAAGTVRRAGGLGGR